MRGGSGDVLFLFARPTARLRARECTLAARIDTRYTNSWNGALYCATRAGPSVRINPTSQDDAAG